MKLLKFLFIAVLTVFMVSCGGDDEGPSGPQLTFEDFAGTYSLTFLESTIVVNGTFNGQPVTSTTDIVGDTFTNSDIVFNENGSYSSDFSYRQTSTTTVNGGTPMTDTEIVVVSDTGVYSLSEANDTVTIDGVVFDVTRYTNNELRLSLTDTEVDGDTTTDTTSELRFTRN